jgi:hypothetical protein
MKKLVIITSGLLLSLGLASCNNPSTNQATETMTPASSPEVTQVTTPTSPIAETTTPSIDTTATPNLIQVATVKSMQQGDIMCYVTLEDESGSESQVGATFEICAGQDQYIGKQVRLSYEEANVNDCQSNEPCGKTRKETLISAMEILNEETTSEESSATPQLEVATVKSMQQGDIMCYVTLEDESGSESQVGATFEICADQDQYIGKQVRLSYEEANVNDCESIEPCGKTRRETLISGMEPVN